jgi:hypothetical protein
VTRVTPHFGYAIAARRSSGTERDGISGAQPSERTYRLLLRSTHERAIFTTLCYQDMPAELAGRAFRLRRVLSAGGRAPGT